MNSRTLLLVLVLLLAGSFFFLVSPNPEQATLESRDNLFSFEALTTQKLSLLLLAGGASTARVSPTYHIEPALTFEVPAKVRFISDLDPKTHTLAFKAGDEKETWEILSTAYEAGAFVAEVGGTGSFALLQMQKVEGLESYGDLVDALVGARPKEAEAGRFQFAYALEEGDYVSIPQSVLFGGCGGNVISASSSLQREEVSRPGPIFIGDVIRTGWQKVSVEWFLGGGCQNGEVFQLVR